MTRDGAPGPLPSHGTRLFAFSLYDFAGAGFTAIIVTVLFSEYYAGVVAGGAAGVMIGGHRVPGATLFAWLVSLSMAVITAVSPFLGVLADRRLSRTLAVGAFWIPGVVFNFLLITVGPGNWLRGGVLFVLAYGCFAAGSIFYNALLPEVGPPERRGRDSGISWGAGYLGGALILILDLLMLKKPEWLGFRSGRFTIQDCFASSAWWWFLFAIPLFWVFRYEARRRPRASGESLRLEAGRTVAQVVATLRRLSGTRNLRRFFFAYLFYNDGVQTVITMASIFGSQALGMHAEDLILFFLLIQGTAFAGSMVLGWLADRWSHKGVLLVCVAAWTLCTLWAAFIGLFGNAVREYWILGACAGLFLGGIQSCSRSLLSEWIPVGRESEFFGFFSIMTRVASIFGPLVYGLLVLLTGDLRRAILSVTVFFLAGGVLLLGVRPSFIGRERDALAGVQE